MGGRERDPLAQRPSRRYTDTHTHTHTHTHTRGQDSQRKRQAFNGTSARGRQGNKGRHTDGWTDGQKAEP